MLGLDPFRDVYTLQQRIGVQLQQAQLQKRIKVWEAVHLWASLYPKTGGRRRLLEQLGLADKRNAWFMTLSGGQKQRLFIALALINDPELVFLDELTTGLDPQARRAIWDLVRGIRERGKTVFLTTHLMEEAERLCDRVAIIEHGRIIDIDTPARLVARHCPERTVVLTTSDPGGGERFRAIPRVEAVSAARTASFTIRGTRRRLRHRRDPVSVGEPDSRHRLPDDAADARRRVSETDRSFDTGLVIGCLRSGWCGSWCRVLRSEPGYAGARPALAPDRRPTRHRRPDHWTSETDTNMLRGLWKLTWLEIKIFVREPLGASARS